MTREQALEMARRFDMRLGERRSRLADLILSIDAKARAEERARVEWQPIATAPKDGTWILGINNRGNQAVIIWSNHASNKLGGFFAGWIHPFSSGELSSFWNGGCGSVPTHWMPLPLPPEENTKIIRAEFPEVAK